MPSKGVRLVQREGKRSRLRVMPRRADSSCQIKRFQPNCSRRRAIRNIAAICVSQQPQTPPARSATQICAATGPRPTSCMTSPASTAGTPEVRRHTPSKAAPDPGTIKLNHAIHLRHDLKGPNGSVQLDCGDCHRTAGTKESWKFGSMTPAQLNAKDVPPSRQTGRANMVPIAYAKHCSGCHGLQFDARAFKSKSLTTPRRNSRVPSSEISAVHPQPSVGASRGRAKSKSPPAACDHNLASSHCTGMGHVASGRVGRTSLAESLLAVSLVGVRTECAAADDHQIRYCV